MYPALSKAFSSRWYPVLPSYFGFLASESIPKQRIHESSAALRLILTIMAQHTLWSLYHTSAVALCNCATTNARPFKQAVTNRLLSRWAMKWESHYPIAHAVFTFSVCDGKRQWEASKVAGPHHALSPQGLACRAEHTAPPRACCATRATMNTCATPEGLSG